MTATTTASSPTTSRKQSMAIAAFGTIIEWYDFSIFFYVATSITRVFFGGDASSLVFTLGIASIGFLFRPIGGIVFGHIGDRIGRRNSLVISSTLMAAALIGVALVPGSDITGSWGGVLVVALRCLAGFSVGAEYTGIMVYLMETATDRNRGFVASLAVVASEVGSLLAVGLGALTSRTLSQEAMDAWGWRLLFLVGGALALTMIPLRHRLAETDTFEASQSDEGVAKENTRSPVIVAITQYPKSVLLAFLISATGSVTYFLNITHVPTYIEVTTGAEAASSLGLGTIAAVVAIAVTPLVGMAADRFGRRPVLAVIAAAVILGTVPAYWMLAGSGTTGTGAATAIIGVALLAIPAAGWSAVAASAIPEQFTAVGRFSGMALGYNLATAIFGATPMVATWVQQSTGNPLAPAIVATAVVALTGITSVVLMTEHSRDPLAEVDQLS